MALSRVKTWVAAEVLYAADLNAEFDNILNNGLSVVSPWTANMDAGGFRLIGLAAGTAASPSIQPTGDTNTGVRFSAADTIDFVTAGTDRWQVNPSGHWLATADNTYDIGASGATRPRNYFGAGTGTFGGLLTGAGFTGTGTTPITPAAAPTGTPDQHGLFRENVLKGWARVSGDGTTLRDSFNVTSLTDTGAGDLTVTWKRSFANTNYIALAVAQDVGGNVRVCGQHSGTGPALGSTRFASLSTTPTYVDPGEWHILVIGGQ